METPNVQPLEIAQSKLALSIDDQFKNQRSRSVLQVLNMVLRWRIISNGFYDFQLQRYVDPIAFEQAAIALDRRHRLVTGQDQHIARKTLDDYYEKIKCGQHPVRPYDFKLNCDQPIKHLRRHCEETKKLFRLE